jgi:hypothetical protein
MRQLDEGRVSNHSHDPDDLFELPTPDLGWFRAQEGGKESARPGEGPRARQYQGR